MTEAAEVRQPKAMATLRQGRREALDGFTVGEAAQLVALLEPMITNLGRVDGVETTPQASL